MENYYISTEIEENMPTYDFILKAKTEKEAEKLAHKIIKKDYPEHYKYGKASDIYIEEITAEKLLKDLTLN